MRLDRSTPDTGSSGAQGLWSESTAKPHVSRTQRGYGPKTDERPGEQEVEDASVAT